MRIAFVRIVTIARLVKKGVEYALRAFTHLRTSAALEYTIIGDGLLRADLETLAREVNPGVTVRFTGWLRQGEVATTLERRYLSKCLSLRTRPLVSELLVVWHLTSTFGFHTYARTDY